MARANQPSPEAIARYAEMGIKTILNLRGKADTGYYALEREACERHGIALVDQRMHSREPPSKAQVHAAKALFESIQYPALMHCKSGADRAGAMAVLYKHFQNGIADRGRGGAIALQVPARASGEMASSTISFSATSKRPRRTASRSCNGLTRITIKRRSRAPFWASGGPICSSTKYCAVNDPVAGTLVLGNKR